MIRRIRQLVVSATLTVALATGAMAQADSVVVVTYGPDGFRLQAPDDVPVGEETAVLLRRTEGNGWSMSTLSEGDIPSEEAAQMPQNRLVPWARVTREDRARLESQMEAVRASRERSLARMPRMTGEIVDVYEIETQRSVLFEVTAGYERSELDDALVTQLTENGALRRLEVSDGIGYGSLEARFVFDSVEAWNTWKAAPETEAMLGALREATRRMETRMEVRQ